MVTRTTWSAVRTASASQQSVASSWPASQPTSRIVSWCLVLGLGRQGHLVDAGEDLAGALEQDVVALALTPVGRVQAELGGARRGQTGGGDRAALDDPDRAGGGQAGGQGDGAGADRAGAAEDRDGVLAGGRRPGRLGGGAAAARPLAGAGAGAELAGAHGVPGALELVDGHRPARWSGCSLGLPETCRGGTPGRRGPRPG